MIRAVKWGTILKSLVFLVPTMLALGAILDLMTDAGKDVHKAGLAALGIAGAIVLMTASVAVIGSGAAGFAAMISLLRPSP